MHRGDCRAHDVIASRCQPTGLLRRQLLHVAAERLDEESFGHLRKKHSSTRPPTAGFGHQVADRILEPLAGDIVSQIDLDDHREPRKKEAIRMALATKESAYQARRLTTAAELQCREVAGEVTLQCPISVDDARRTAV
jgi:hypothetical protein